MEEVERVSKDLENRQVKKTVISCYHCHVALLLRK